MPSERGRSRARTMPARLPALTRGRMPTGGTARFASPLNVLDFVRITSIIELDDQTTTRLAPAAATLARAEALTAHASAAEMRVRP